jgi:hypothetical protein
MTNARGTGAWHPKDGEFMESERWVRQAPATLACCQRLQWIPNEARRLRRGVRPSAADPGAEHPGAQALG